MLLAARLRAQLLSGVRPASPLEATRQLLAVQAQDPRGARLAIRARSTVKSATSVDRALNERELVITWVNRGTLHLVAVEDEALLHLLTTPQLRTGCERRLRQEGVSEAAERRGVRAVAAALESGPHTREELRGVVEQRRVPTAGQALVHLLFAATLDGLIVRGPMRGPHQQFVLAADWLGHRPALDIESAAAELARRYLQGHGPASARDLAKWAGIGLGAARAALGLIAPQLVELPGGLVDLRDRPRPPHIPPAALLGAFDPLLLGWSDRDLIVGEDQQRIVNGGVFRPFALIAGRAAGTWSLERGRVSLDLWDKSPPRPSTAAALAREAAAVESYLR
ncbi:MAG TPA: winged helix DNA-binding domain-containing protein [Solirubrobacteraceae bacterium]|nr:winged helix DNA-binding domain-containing protein [Solirubrobacteraceae bacterium]